MKEGAALTKFQTGIAAKLGVCLVVSVTAIMAGLGYLNLRLHWKNSHDLMLASAERLCDIILQSTRQEMLRNDRDILYHTIKDIGSEPGISRVRIFNKEGRISFSTDRAEVGRIVDKQAEACYACHAQGVPLERLNRPDSSRIISDPAGGRVLAMIRPIRNEPTCSSAACHAHPPEKKVLGVIDVHLSLAAVDQRASYQSSMLVLVSIGAIVLIGAVSGWFVYKVVHRPIKALIAGTHRVAGGDLTYRLEPASSDELGDLALSFNKMTRDLAEAHAELSHWAAQLEDRVRRKTDELERAHKYLVGSEKMAGIGKLAATVAHEVNNPLFGILTYARLCLKELERDQPEPAARERMLNQLRIIERESRRCGDIIKNLLTYARQAPRKRESNDVNAIADRAVALVRHQFKLQNVELETQLDPALPPIVCDAGQVQQVILVLMTNAAEATGEGGHLWLRTEPFGEGIRISLKDDGGGIPPEILPQIFDPFFTTKEDKLRTGLGLAVAKSIVEQHGGAIEAHSEPGRGATFVVTLPLEAPAQVVADSVRGTAA